MKRFLITWLLSAIALLITAFLVKGIVLKGAFAIIVTPLILGIINAIIRPVLFWLTLPLNILTLGLFTLVLNGICLLLVDFFGPPGFRVRGLVSAIVGALVLSMVSWILGLFIKEPANA